MTAWKIICGPFAVSSRRRVVVSAIIYGLTLTIRLTTPAGQDASPPPPTQTDSAPFSIMAKDRNSAFSDRPPMSRICRNGCERPLQLASVLDCAPP